MTATARQIVKDLLQENASLRGQLSNFGVFHTDHAAREAAIAWLDREDEAKPERTLDEKED